METRMKEILKSTREILTPEGAWIRDGFARDARGFARDPEDPRAAAWTLIGALELSVFDSRDFSDSGPNSALKSAIFALQTASGVDSLAAWNDGQDRTHEEVLQLLDRAIAA